MWVKLDDHFVDHPKVLAVGPVGLALFVAGLCYANRLLTNGFIPENQVDRLLHRNGGRRDEPAKLAAKLCEVGLWSSATVKQAKGYLIHDFLKYQPSRKQVLRSRKQTAKRVARWRNQVTRKVTRE